MLSVACERIDAILPDGASMDAALARIPDMRRRKALAFRFEADRRRSVAAWLLVERLLAARGVDVARLVVADRADGKPELDRPRGLHFSLSHADERVMAAVSDNPVGCDVEKVVPIEDGVVEAAMTPEEVRMLHEFPKGAMQDVAFTRFWVRRESRFKAGGEGNLSDYDFGDGYLGCVCEASDGKPVSDLTYIL